MRSVRGTTQKQGKTGKLLSLRAVAVLIAVSVLLSTIGVAIALTIRAAQIQKIDLWGGNIQGTDFLVTELDTKIKGKNKVEINLTVKNNGADNHTASVTVQLLDSAGDVIVEQAEDTGIVTASGTWSYAYSFDQSGLVGQLDQPFVVIEQTG